MFAHINHASVCSESGLTRHCTPTYQNEIKDVGKFYPPVFADDSYVLIMYNLPTRKTAFVYFSKPCSHTKQTSETFMSFFANTYISECMNDEVRLYRLVL